MVPPARNRPEPRDLIRAATLLTRLPLPGGDGTRMAAAAWAWPLIGAGVALAQLTAGLGALALGLPVAVAAGLALAVGIVLTGALHEDGLADCADGFWGGHDVARRLDILKDSRIGTYGVLALILSAGLRWSLIAALLVTAPLTLLAAAMLSRSGMAFLMARARFARDGGLAVRVGRPPRWSALGAVALACAGSVVLLGSGPAAGAAVATALAIWAVGALARAKIGGQTGDVLGAAQQMAEISALAALAALLG